MATEDWHALVAGQSCQEFSAAHPHPFLIAASGLESKPGSQLRTIRMAGGAALEAALKAERRRIASGVRSPTVIPVRKVQSTFSTMISVGRANSNDVVVPDALVSNFHAVFRQLEGGTWALADAGSANGTRIGERQLPPKGTPEPVHPGDRITFGVSVFRFLDAAGLWAALR
jgi:hypothetical protein